MMPHAPQQRSRRRQRGSLCGDTDCSEHTVARRVSAFGARATAAVPAVPSEKVCLDFAQPRIARQLASTSRSTSAFPALARCTASRQQGASAGNSESRSCQSLYARQAGLGAPLSLELIPAVEPLDKATAAVRTCCRTTSIERRGPASSGGAPSSTSCNASHPILRGGPRTPRPLASLRRRLRREQRGRAGLPTLISADRYRCASSSMVKVLYRRPRCDSSTSFHHNGRGHIWGPRCRCATTHYWPRVRQPRLHRPRQQLPAGATLDSATELYVDLL